MLLRMGPLPVSTLAIRANVKRVTAYSVLEALIDRGLVSYEKRKMCRYYSPHDPECLMYLLEQKSAEIKFQMDLARDCISKLSRFTFS